MTSSYSEGHHRKIHTWDHEMDVNTSPRNQFLAGFQNIIYSCPVEKRQILTDFPKMP